MPIWLKKNILFSLILCTGLLSFVNLAEAGTKRHKGAASPQFLTRHKIKIMAFHIAKDLSRQDVFIKKDLPPKMSLGLFAVNVPTATATGRDFTDAVLNAILNQTSVLIVNQDAQMGESLDFKLQRYEDSKTLRIRGALLGATYYVVGSVQEHTLTVKPGKVKKAYKANYGVYDIHTNAVILEHDLVFTESAKLLKERKPHVGQ